MSTTPPAGPRNDRGSTPGADTGRIDAGRTTMHPQSRSDRLLGQVEELLRARDRATRLLDIVIGLGADLDLEAILERIVIAACDLSGARYGALGVLGPDSSNVSRLITHGLSDDEIAAIGRFPTGHGIVGLLVEDPRPLRLREISEHPQAHGFPPHHPPMHSFLGVPVKIRDTVYGNLYLTEKTGHPEFSDEDEQVVTALAGAAGVVIENARLYAETDRRQRWNAAIAEITQALLGDFDADDVFTLIAVRTAEVTGASWAAVVVADAGGSADVRAAGGDFADEAVDRVASVRRALDSALTSGQPLVVEVPLRLAEQPDSSAQAQILVSPFRSTFEQRPGGLVVMWRPNTDAASKGQAEIVRRFAELATLTLDLSQSIRDRATLAVFEDRDRIARDLHDLVIQRLYATGLSLQGMRRLVVRPEVNRRIGVAVDDLDATIRDIRATIFELQHGDAHVSLRSELLAMVADYAAALTFTPSVHLAGPIDALRLPPLLREHLTAAVREGLANAARHAAASAIDVSVALHDGSVTATITDDGIGIGDTSRRSGLANLRERAEQVGGTLCISPNRPGGTVLEFRMPLPAGDR